MTKPTYHLISLGCAKNLVDSEVMLGALSRAGMQLIEEPERADFLIVNTCGFIQPAVEEAIEEIMNLLQLKEDNPVAKVIVVGCLVQRYKEQLVKELPEVDIFLGTEGPDQIADILLNSEGQTENGQLHLPERFLMSSDTPRIISTPFFRSWLKITEGCNNHCSYCKIPSIRGPLRSRSSNDLIKEAVRLEAAGVKELSIVAQDSTAYGNDLNSQSEGLVALLKQLILQTTIPWIRVLYLYPTGVTDELLELMVEHPRLLPYLDIPMQHVSNTILKAMNRPYGVENLVGLLGNIRNHLPDIAIRTTFLVGFPGETENDFLKIESFLKQAKIDHVGVFPYANEEGCPAEKLHNHLPDEEKFRRRDHLLEVQGTLTEKKLKQYVGKIEPVLVEGVSSETDLLLEGRTKYQAPEVDGRVYINDGIANAGDIVQVKITDSQVYDLVGGIVSES